MYSLFTSSVSLSTITANRNGLNADPWCSPTCYGEIHYNFYLGITLSLFDAYYVCAFSIRHAETLKLQLRHNVSD